METRYLQSDGHRYWANIDITAEEWEEMLQDEAVIASHCLDMFRYWYAEPEHEATASVVWSKWGNSSQGQPYNAFVQAVGRRIVRYLDRFEVKQYENPQRNSYWILMFEGEHVKGKSGSFKWKLRTELAFAMECLGIV